MPTAPPSVHSRWSHDQARDRVPPSPPPTPSTTRRVHGATTAIVVVAATVLTGLSAGFFLTYTMSVTRGLALVDDVAWLTTFQAINETVRTPVFMVVFAGPVPALAMAAWLTRDRPPARWLVVAALVAQVTVVGVTFTGNVPLNDQLANVAATLEAATAARVWFEHPWNQLNFVRTVASVLAAAATATAAVVVGRARQ